MKYIKQKVIGDGANANIYLADAYAHDFDDAPINQVAIKEPRHPNISIKHEYSNAIRLEQTLPRSDRWILQHLCLPIGFMENGSIVYPLIRGHIYYREKNKHTLLKALIQVNQVVQILWKNGITHNDINDSNIMIDTTRNHSPILIDMGDMEFENKPKDVLTDIDGYQGILRQKIYLFEDKETKDLLRYCVQRMENMTNIHMQKAFFRLRFAQWMMDEIKQYLQSV